MWQAETLNENIAALMGLQKPRFSGIGFGRLAKWLQSQWRFPTKDGPGLYTYNGQRPTMPFWSGECVYFVCLATPYPGSDACRVPSWWCC